MVELSVLQDVRVPGAINTVYIFYDTSDQSVALSQAPIQP